MKHQEIVFSSEGVAVLRQAEAHSVQVSVAAGELRGGTVCSLISPGTELAWLRGGPFPLRPGYAAVFRVEEVGAGVEGIRPGDLRLCMGPHRSWQHLAARDTLPLPDGLAPAQALLARLMGVSMTTLMSTAARPGDQVVVSGAGPVGFLAAQLLRLAGCEVLVVEPDAGRRALVERVTGLRTRAAMPLDDIHWCGQVALVLDCSGHEQSVLDACAVVRPRGEVVLVGVPWRRQTEIHAHALLDLVFRRFVVLRSGWEWELPMHAREFRWEELLQGYNNAAHSVMGGFGKALRWLAEGRIMTAGLCASVSPGAAVDAYADLAARRGEALFVSFDWQR